MCNSAAEQKYRVSVQKMVESGDRVTWWVCLDHPSRALDAKPWDKGRMTPYMSKDKEKADFTAWEWAKFFGVEAEGLTEMKYIEDVM